MTKQEIPEEVEAHLPEMFDQISKHLTPDFSSIDWMDLFKKASAGDRISQQMFSELFYSKVLPYLDMDEVNRFNEEHYQ